MTTPIDPGSQTPSNIDGFSIARKGYSGTIDDKLGVVHAPESKDTLETSGPASQALSSPDSDHPTLLSPDVNKVNGLNLQQALKDMKANPWFAPSFLAKFTTIINSQLDQQRNIHLQEAFNEMDVRGRLFELSKSTAALAKALMDNQSQEQLTQAIAAFANAGVSMFQFVQTTGNLGRATKQVDDKIAAQQQKILDIKYPPDGTRKVADYNAKKLEQLAIPKPGIDSPEITAQKNILAKMNESREADIQAYMRNFDQQVQTMGEAQKQTINGVSSVLASIIKTDSGVKEEMQKILEGFIQSMNKFSETTAKSRDDAAANFTRFLDFMNKIIESDFKAHSISGRA